VVVGDLPVTALLTPHVGEARRYRLAVGTLTELKGVHARVQVGQAVFVHLHAVVGDGAEGVLEDELLEVVFGEVPALDVLGRDRRKEGEAGGIQRGNLLGVLGLQGGVPLSEVLLKRASERRIARARGAHEREGARERTYRARGEHGTSQKLSL
jgi:hypothetical protein